VDFSVTITTCNRAESLRRGLEALAAQDFAPERFEVIVADNGSCDHTRSVAETVGAQFAHFRYLFDARPGQLVGWHRAFQIAQGTITCFIDDDVRPEPGWLSALAEAYRDPRVGLATGPIRLVFEEAPPDWLAAMTLGPPGAQTQPFLGGLDAGTAVRDIGGNLVWGSNFTVRRNVLIEAHGFHPCAMPWALIRFYGDGEIHVGRTAQQNGHRILYHPAAAVAHDIPGSRLTLEAVHRKFTSSGCARAFQTLRAARALFAAPSAEEIRVMARRYFAEPDLAPKDVIEAVESGLASGLTQQRDGFEQDAAFRDWVLQPDFLDLDRCYRHPDLMAAVPAQDGDWRSGAA
jgi:glucosyl-dolichyl phosphate glucuronosyltransferase